MGIVKNNLVIISILTAAMFFVGCASVQSSFTPEVIMTLDRKENYKEVEFLPQKPSRVALRIGVISSNGNGFAGFDDLIVEAKKKAARIGGDFILVENSGVDTQTVYNPGYSSYNSNSSLSWGSSNGYGGSNASAYSVGPSVYNIHRPWSKFSVWVYAPAQLGVRFDGGNVISTFHLKSDAKKAGVKIGDKILGIDGYDVFDEKVIHHLMTVHPGDKVKLSLLRGSKQVECQITALVN